MLFGLGIESRQLLPERGDGRVDEFIIGLASQALLESDGLLDLLALAVVFRWRHEIIPLIHPSLLRQA
jgi:hypothetical protein